MGCGCGRKGVARSRRRAISPSVGPKSSPGGVAAGATPAQVRALGLVSSQSPKEASRMDEQRLLIEKKRREAIRRKLNK